MKSIQTGWRKKAVMFFSLSTLFSMDLNARCACSNRPKPKRSHEQVMTVDARCACSNKPKPKRNHDEAVALLLAQAKVLKQELRAVAGEHDEEHPVDRSYLDYSCNLAGLLEDIVECWEATKVLYCEELPEQVAECCEAQHENFHETWTIVAGLSEQLEDCCRAQAECCEELSHKFQETWTILADDALEIGDPSDAGGRCCDYDDPDEVDADDMSSVFKWLKSIYIEFRRGNQGKGTDCGDPDVDPWNGCTP